MASLIHPSPCEGVKSELDLFAVPPTQTSLERGHYVEHRPQSVILEGSVEFVVSEEGNYYIDLANTFLYVRGAIVKANGTAITRGGVLEDVLGLEDTFSSPWPWRRSLKSLALASRP